MKEFMYATALCFLMLAIWSFSKTPSEEAIKQVEPALVEQMRQDRETLRFISGGALVLSVVCGVVGWRSRSREDASKKSVE
ncbi:hypothetical protein ACQUQP_03395 [Marinobacterium sp. YM272]|uniref:hypothetical protein n=1 Tax=Marinobacterium sp. YM272 TaxID=3421654 RepID=UPI003D7F723B